ncbi:hypothetical protein BN14_10218 [Rhizoctonia solani AG-1 IB]|uniref:Fungal-type protein kinase domain-containing protein n=1 Tax=Thanatephorus cucumeris (strain AG1-IB / isolate 7/3/14) TaxID=1108050 RepID=M5CAK7_THACB|nr:hypothetical protein BN14_10218 [Rhizoctonia solani AG-1 IB]
MLAGNTTNAARSRNPTPLETTVGTTSSTTHQLLVDPTATTHTEPSQQSAIRSFGTPLAPLSSDIDPTCSGPSQSLGHQSGGDSKTLGTQHTEDSSEVMGTSLEIIESFLRHKLCGAVHLHKELFREFFGASSSREPSLDIQAEALEVAFAKTPGPTESVGKGNLISYSNTDMRWTIHHHNITGQMNEKKVYEPLTEVLNRVSQATFEVDKTTDPSDKIRRDYVKFINHISNDPRHDSPGDGDVSPGLFQGTTQGGRLCCSIMELIIGCELDHSITRRNEAYMRLACYARATFVHQIYRLHVFGFSSCGPVVNFVRFDRSGMLHSPDLDLSKPKDASMFIEHIITLLAPDSCQFGYDNRYSFNYCSSPLRTLFSFRKNPAQPVTEVLCHRKYAYGRATCVTRLGEDVHRSIWHDENRPDGGATMSHLVNVFGFCQLKDHSDVDYSTRLRYPEELEWSHATTYFAPSSQRFSSETTETRTVLRGIRVKSDIIMRRGTSLFKVQNPLHLVMAMHDALLDPEKHYAERDWLGQPTFEVKPDVWKRNARGELAEDAQKDDNERDISQYESPCLKRAKELGRRPCCILPDTDLMVDEGRNHEVHGGRTGTPAFISAQLLDPGKPSQEEGRWKVNEHAKMLMKLLSNDDMEVLHGSKELLVSRAALGESFSAMILKLENPWCKDLAWLLTEFAELLFYYLYYQVPSSLGPDEVPEEDSDEDSFKRSFKDAIKQRNVYHNRLLDQPNLQTFQRLFRMFDKYIRFLNKKRPDYQMDMIRP